MKKIITFLILIISINFQTSTLAEVPHFINFKFILNQSEAGKKAQKFLKAELDNGIKKLEEKEKKIQEEEKKIVAQKKIISPEEYKKKVTALRNNVSSLQKERNELLNSVAKKRASARNELLKNLNPIIKSYMTEKKIRMVIDKKNLLLADDSLDITKDIMALLNKNLKSIKLN